MSRSSKLMRTIDSLQEYLMRFMLLLPGLLNILLLGFLWNDVDRPVLGAVWCLVGIGLHVISDLGSPGWFAGLLMNLGAIIYLLIRFGVHS